VERVSFAVGDRVQVRPEYDETLRVLEMRTGPGVIDAIHGAGIDVLIVVNLDEGQSVPYKPHELTRIGDGA
jgi:hypothetical protein